MNTWLLQQLGLVTLGVSMTVALWWAVRARCGGRVCDAYRLGVVALPAMLSFIPLQAGVAAWNHSQSLPRAQTVVTELVVAAGARVAPAPAAAGSDDAVADCTVPVDVGQARLRVPLAAMLLCVYSIGTAFALIIGAGRCLAAWRLVARGRGIDDPSTLAVWREVRHEMAVGRNVRLLETRALAGPACFGPWRCSVLLPKADPRLRDAAKLALVLRHELTHLARRDPLVSIGVALLLAVQWFNPLVWLFARRLHEDKESSCDACVVAATGSARAYALTLLDFGYTKGRARTSAVFAGFGAERLEGALSRRLQMIEAMTTSSVRGRSRFALAACLALGCGLPALHTATASLQDPPPKTEAVTLSQASGEAKKAVIQAPPGSRSTPSVRPMRFAPFAEKQEPAQIIPMTPREDTNLVEQETIVSAQNAAVTERGVESDEVILSLPEGSDLVATVEGEVVLWERAGDATLLWATGGTVRITDAQGVDRVVARQVRDAGETLHIDPVVENGQTTLRLALQHRTAPIGKADKAGIEAWVQVKSGEVEIRLRSLGGSDGRIKAEFDSRIAELPSDKPTKGPAIGYQFLPAEKAQRKPSQFKMQWTYGPESMEGC